MPIIEEDADAARVADAITSDVHNSYMVKEGYTVETAESLGLSVKDGDEPYKVATVSRTQVGPEGDVVQDIVPLLKIISNGEFSRVDDHAMADLRRSYGQAPIIHAAPVDPDMLDRTYDEILDRETEPTTPHRPDSTPASRRV